MIGHTTTRLAWMIWAFSLLLATVSLGLVYLSRFSDTGSALQDIGPLAFLSLEFASLGILIVSRRSGNRIGWLFCVIGMAWAIQGFASAYANYALLVRPGVLPGGAVVAWIHTWFWLVTLGLGTFLFMFFPNGNLPSQRWRVLPMITLLGIALGIFARATRPNALIQYGLANPVALEGASAILTVLNFTALSLLLASFLASSVSLRLRLRHSNGLERQQIKVFAYGAAVAGFVIVVAVVVNNYLFAYSAIIQILLLLAIASIPMAAGIAILRSHLWDIDVIIRRTLVYGVLTVLLAMLFFGSVFAMQRLFVQVTGQQSEIALIASTLLIAALALPLRNRIQAVIDRRFYRKKYDAQKTVEAFTARLQTETDVTTLAGDLQSAICEALQPASVKVWLVENTPRQTRSPDSGRSVAT